MNLFTDFTLKSVLLLQRRNFAEKVPDPVKPATAASGNVDIRTTSITNFDKRVLVWTKKFKSIDEVPSHVA